MGDGMSDDYYRRWNDAECVDRFAGKNAADFFATETKFLRAVGPEIASVLDIGCASGRFIELLNDLSIDAAYTGVDIGPANIARARDLYPQHSFHLINALDFEPKERFDLVNATGVCQHEPRFAALIDKMIGWSSKYVLFDLKLANLDNHLIDIERSYSGTDNRLYFVLASLPRLIQSLSANPDIAAVSVFGYETRPNANTTVPQTVARFVSAGILITKGDNDGLPAVTCDLPDFLEYDT